MTDYENNTLTTLSRKDLGDIAKALLHVARTLLENGAETRRVFETIKEMGNNMGLDELHVLVTHRSVLVTVVSEDMSLTRIIRVGTLGVNHTIISAISRVFQRTQDAKLNPVQVEEMVKRISSEKAQYPRWLVLIMVGLACGGFSRISGGDWMAFIACSLAATLGIWLRQSMHKLHFQPMLCVFAAAFLSATLATVMARGLGSYKEGAAVAASVLYLVPGVPMINAVADLVKGHLLTGIARAVTVMLTAVFVSLGLILAMRTIGLSHY